MHTRELLSTEASGLGTAAPCSVIERCGGCPLLGKSAEHERAWKLARIRDALVNHLEGDAPDVGWVASPRRIAYRNRIRLRIDEDGSVAFFNPEKAPECPVLEPALLEAVQRVVRLGAETPGDLADYRHVEVRAPDAKGRPAAYFRARTDEVGRRARLRIEMLRPEFLVAESTDDVDALPAQRFAVGRGVDVPFPIDGFLQVNGEVNRLLVAHVVGRAIEAGHRTFVDLFAGAGNFALPLARAGLSGTAVERHPGSVRWMRREAATHGFRLEAVATDVSPWLEQESGTLGRRDLVVVDGPRAGLRSGHAAVAALADTVALCSCNPRSFARDIAAFRELGLAPDGITAFDMFPGTEHVELVGWLRRTPIATPKIGHYVGTATGETA